jgi:NAD(P)H dehydrogenase (quinone)
MGHEQIPPSTKSVAVVYYSGSGHTAKMADAACRGVSGVLGTPATPFRIDGRSIRDGRLVDEVLLRNLSTYDAIMFGTPTYMGGPAAQFKAFADATGPIWFARSWLGKYSAGFTHSGSPSGDKLLTLQYLSIFAAQHGMIWIGNAELGVGSNNPQSANRLGSYLGVMGSGKEATGQPPLVEVGDLLTAEMLGQRVATIIRAFDPSASKQPTAADS